MNLAFDEARDLVSKLAPVAGERVILAPPYPYLKSLKDAFPGITLAAQDCSAFPAGAYTGEVSASMLASVGIRYCIVGHSERRQYHGETDAAVAAKVDRLLENKMTPIVCCGERLEVREKKLHKETVSSQLEGALFHLDAGAISKCIIAYEPVWAIGTGVTASMEQAQEMHAWIRLRLTQHYTPEIGSGMSILYGGSVTAANAAGLFSCPDVDGGLVGGASLKAAEFLEIINALQNT